MGLLKRDDILKAADLQREPVSVPEWGGDVFVRVMTAAERDEWELMTFGQDGKAFDRRLIRAKLALFTVCDDAGGRIFGDADLEPLAGKSAVAINRVWDVAIRLNGIGTEAIEALEKNSDSAR